MSPVSRQQWEWQLLGADEVVLEEPVSPAFTGRFDAESWLGEQWRHLAGQGVAAAQLVQGGRPVAAPVPLRST